MFKFHSSPPNDLKRERMTKYTQTHQIVFFFHFTKSVLLANILESLLYYFVTPSNTYRWGHHPLCVRLVCFVCGPNITTSTETKSYFQEIELYLLFFVLSFIFFIVNIQFCDENAKIILESRIFKQLEISIFIQNRKSKTKYFCIL